MTTKQELEAAVIAAQKTLDDASSALAAFNALPENHVYETLDDAEYEVENYLEKKAFKACEGAGNCGLDEYTQEFIVDGVKYIGTLTIEYNRHDKTYYYIDSAQFSYKAVEEA